MEPTVQLPINVMQNIQPVDIVQLTIAQRMSNVEQILNINPQP